MLLSSCANTHEICEVIEPVTVSVDDVLTKQTKEDIVKVNLLIKRVCD